MVDLGLSVWLGLCEFGLRSGAGLGHSAFTISGKHTLIGMIVPPLVLMPLHVEHLLLLLGSELAE